MKLIELFDKKIKYFENEIRNLKTAHFKTATAISTTTVNTSARLEIKLYGNPLYYYEMISEKRAVITLTTLDNTNMIGAVYLKGMTPSGTNDRRIFLRKIASGEGQLKYELTVYSQNENDYNTLAGGGTVFVTYALECVGSSRFSVNVEYKDFYKGGGW